jgi:amidohydrolase
LQEEIPGTLLFVFQPGEERIPGGAKLMLEEGLFGDKEPDFMFAQHVYPEMNSGEAGFRPGIDMASADEVFITVKGKGGHAALPDRLTDSVLIAAHIITALQQVVSRRSTPGLPTVLSFGKVTANGAVNIIPDEVHLEGTFRTMDEDWRKNAHKYIEDISIKTAEAMGGTAVIEIRKGYPVLVNHPGFTEFLSSSAKDFLGKDKVKDLNIRMTAEDFAYFSQKYPAVMYRLGVATPDSESWPSLHTPSFNIDERALQTGYELMAWLGYSSLKEHAS